MTRIGKIARLPHEVREQLNRRLQDGEPGAGLLKWLNRRPDVKKLLAREFEGRPINPQNLSDWKAGGYRDWLTHQHALEVGARVAAQAGEFKESLGGKPLTEVLAQWLAGQYLVAAPALAEQAATDERAWAKLRELSHDLAVLRRGDHWAQRLRLERARVQIACNQECRAQDEEMRQMIQADPAYHQVLREYKDQFDKKEGERRDRMTKILLRVMFGDLADDDDDETSPAPIQRPAAFPKPTPPPPPDPNAPDPKDEELTAMEKHWGVKTKPKAIPNAAAQGPADGIDDEDWEPDEEGEDEVEGDEGEEGDEGQASDPSDPSDPTDPSAPSNQAEAKAIKPDQAKSSQEENGEGGAQGASALPQSALGNPQSAIGSSMSPSPRPSPPMGARENAEGGAQGAHDLTIQRSNDVTPPHPPSTPSATPPAGKRPLPISVLRDWRRPPGCILPYQIKEEFIKYLKSQGYDYYDYYLS